MKDSTSVCILAWVIMTLGMLLSAEDSLWMGGLGAFLTGASVSIGFFAGALFAIEEQDEEGGNK